MCSDLGDSANAYSLKTGRVGQGLRGRPTLRRRISAERAQLGQFGQLGQLWRDARRQANPTKANISANSASG